MPLGLIRASQPIPTGTDVALLARLRAQSYALVTQATLTSIAWTVTDTVLGTLLGNGTFTISQVIFDTLVKSDPSWSRDGPPIFAPENAYGFPGSVVGTDQQWGYNFRGIIPGSVVPLTSAGNDLQADVTFTFVGGEVLKQPFGWTALKVYA